MLLANCHLPVADGCSPTGRRNLALLLLLAVSACAGAQSGSRDPQTGQSSLPEQKETEAVPEANPARPTVATPATLTPVGYLQFENGIQYAADSAEFSSRVGVNQVTKLTVHPRLQFLLQSEPVVHSGQGAVKEFDPGDILAGIQAVALPGQGKRPTVSLSYFKHVYAGSAPDVDFGTPEHSLLMLISSDLAGFHFDLNGLFNEQVQDKVGRAQFGQTISISHPVKKFTVAGELWHFTQPFLHGNAVGNLWAVSYPVRRNLVVDAGFNRGLTSTSTQWEGFAGFTYVLPHRLWKAQQP